VIVMMWLFGVVDITQDFLKKQKGEELNPQP